MDIKTPAGTALFHCVLRPVFYVKVYRDFIKDSRNRQNRRDAEYLPPVLDRREQKLYNDRGIGKGLPRHLENERTVPQQFNIALSALYHKCGRAERQERA